MSAKLWMNGVGILLLTLPKRIMRKVRILGFFMLASSNIDVNSRIENLPVKK